MKTVAKYNTLKGVSTALTVGTPIVTLLLSGDLFVHRSATAMSAAGVFTIILLAFIFKDKIVEHWKVPSAFVISAALLTLILIIENILLPIKNVCIATMIATGVDEATFKGMYKRMELRFPEKAKSYKHFGFLCLKTPELEAMANEPMEGLMTEIKKMVKENTK